MGNALDKLFSSEEPKKGTKTKKAATVEPKPEPEPATQAAPPKTGKKAPNKKVCSVCGAEDWPFNMRDGMCKDCKADSLKGSTPAKAEPKAEPKTKKAKKAKKAKKEPNAAPAKAQPEKSDNQKRGLKSEQWHDKEATFNQTSFLKKATGLKTWDLETPLTRLEASAMISDIKDGNGGVEDAKAILIKEFGCVKYVRPDTKKKTTTRPDPAASSKVDRDTAAELVDMKHTIRELEKKLAAAIALAS